MDGLAVLEVILKSLGQIQPVQVSFINALLCDCLPDDQSGERHQGEGTRLQTIDILHADLAVTPHGGDDHVHLLASHAPVRRAKIVTVDNERHGALVHIQDHVELVRHLEGLVGAQTLGVGHARLVVAVMVGLVAAQVPAPGLVIVANERLVADRVEGSVDGAHADHSMGASLLGGPGDLKHVQTGVVANLGADTVGGLGHGVTVECHWILILHINVQTPVIRVPGVTDLGLAGRARHVEQQLKARGKFVVKHAARGFADQRHRGLLVAVDAVDIASVAHQVVTSGPGAYDSLVSSSDTIIVAVVRSITITTLADGTSPVQSGLLSC